MQAFCSIPSSVRAFACEKIRISRNPEKIEREKREAERIAREKREKAERIAREKREKSEQIAKYKEKILLLSEEWGGDLKNLKYHYLNIWRLNEADYATALKGLTPLAEKGNSDAQYILGKMRTGAPLWKKDKEGAV